MSHWGITAVRWNEAHTEIAACKIHRVDVAGDEFNLRDGIDISFEDVISLVGLGDMVWVMDRNARGFFEKRERIRDRSQNEPAWSPTDSSFFDLPNF
jgi:hypothetical protein